jgi:glucose-6-phosphate isomerase
MNLHVDFYGIDAGEEIEKPLPDFAEVEPDFSLDEIDRDFQNLIVIGNGGSITSLRALYYSFLEEADRNLEIVSTMDPDRLRHVEANTDTEDTHVMPISKSGSTVGVLESLMFFVNRGYDFNPLTTPGSPLHQIAEEYGRQIIEHQDVGGRFSGLTNTALAPAELLGLDSRQIRTGGEEAYGKLREKAAETASALYEAENQGYTEVLTPFYSSRMFGFYPLLVQMMHETVCKDGEGQTFYGDHAPEYQHHTNQRLFGGKDNILPFFFRATHRHEKIQIPEKVSDVEVKGEEFGRLNGEDLSDALNAEFTGVKKALQEEGRPFIDLKLEDSGYRGFGKLMAFMQLTAYYSAQIHGVDPLTQPDVEKSKKKGLEERFK